MGIFGKRKASRGVKASLKNRDYCHDIANERHNEDKYALSCERVLGPTTSFTWALDSAVQIKRRRLQRAHAKGKSPAVQDYWDMHRWSHETKFDERERTRIEDALWEELGDGIQGVLNWHIARRPDETGKIPGPDLNPHVSTHRELGPFIIPRRSRDISEYRQVKARIDLEDKLFNLDHKHEPHRQTKEMPERRAELRRESNALACIAQGVRTDTLRWLEQHDGFHLPTAAILAGAAEAVWLRGNGIKTAWGQRIKQEPLKDPETMIGVLELLGYEISRSKTKRRSLVPGKQKWTATKSATDFIWLRHQDWDKRLKSRPKKKAKKGAMRPAFRIDRLRLFHESRTLWLERQRFLTLELQKEKTREQIRETARSPMAMSPLPVIYLTTHPEPPVDYSITNSRGRVQSPRGISREPLDKDQPLMANSKPVDRQIAKASKLFWQLIDMAECSQRHPLRNMAEAREFLCGLGSPGLTINEAQNWIGTPTVQLPLTETLVAAQLALCRGAVRQRHGWKDPIDKKLQRLVATPAKPPKTSGLDPFASQWGSLYRWFNRQWDTPRHFDAIADRRLKSNPAELFLINEHGLSHDAAKVIALLRINYIGSAKDATDVHDVICGQALGRLLAQRAERDAAVRERNEQREKAKAEATRINDAEAKAKTSKGENEARARVLSKIDQVNNTKTSASGEQAFQRARANEPKELPAMVLQQSGPTSPGTDSPPFPIPQQSPPSKIATSRTLGKDVHTNESLPGQDPAKKPASTQTLPAESFEQDQTSDALDETESNDPSSPGLSR